jgi:hypothetical protein
LPKFPGIADLQVTPVRLYAKLKVVAFSESPGHTVDVLQSVVDEVTQLVGKLIESVTV